MRMFSEEVKHTFSNSPLNILQVADFNEVFFGVYEVELNQRKYPVEEVSKYNGNPVVSIPIVVEGVEKEYPFVLLKGDEEIIFNESNTEIPESDVLDVEHPVFEEESNDSDKILEGVQKILSDIERFKKESIKKAQEQILKESEKKNQISLKEKQKREKAYKKFLETARENLVDEFTNISKRIKNELISENDGRFSEIKETIDNKIQDLADALNESLKKDFNNSSKLIDKSIKQLVKDLYEKNINPRVDKELEEIAVEIVEKVSEIDKNLNLKIEKKADVSLVEGVSREVEAIRDSNIELNNSLNKGVQKALSRVGNVDKKIIEVSEKFERKLEETEEELSNYFDEKIDLLKEETLNITDEARSYFQNLIQESRNGLLSEIRKIKDEKPVEYILETKNGKSEVKDWDSIEKNWNKQIHEKIENVRTDLRKYVAVYASGGGTNAQQFADGGTINGDLTANKFISKIFEFDTTYTPTGNETLGSMYWNSTDDTVDLVHNGAVQQLGQELFIKARNTTGTTILNGTPVYINGRQGNRPKIYLAQSDTDATSNVVGVVTEDIDDNSDGFVTTFGYVRQIKTDYSGSGDWGTTWAEGDNLYVSKTVAGQLTNVEPENPHHSDIVGQVGIVGGPGIGSIFINIVKHKTLSELSDVNGTPLSATGQIPVWDNDRGVFDFNYNINDLSTSGAYLPLSGGTLTGTLDTRNTIFAYNPNNTDTYVGFYPPNGSIEGAYNIYSWSINPSLVEGVSGLTYRLPKYDGNSTRQLATTQSLSGIPDKLSILPDYPTQSVSFSDVAGTATFVFGSAAKAAFASAIGLGVSDVPLHYGIAMTGGSLASVTAVSSAGAYGASGQLRLVSSNLNGVNVNGVVVSLASNGVLAFTSSLNNAAGTSDSGLSITGAAAFALGNGTAGNASGTLALANLTASGTVTAGGLSVAGTTAGATGISLLSSNSPSTARESIGAGVATEFLFHYDSAPSGATGGSGTWSWTPPSWAKMMQVLVLGAGGGGGSGARTATGTQAGGGGGGAGGGAQTGTIAVQSGSYTITVGAGGAGGAAVTTDGTNGNDGGYGGYSRIVCPDGNSISSWNMIYGTPARGGTTNAGAGGQAGAFNIMPSKAGTNGGSSSNALSVGQCYAGAAGAGGGGITAANTTTNFGYGGTGFYAVQPAYGIPQNSANGGNGGASGLTGGSNGANGQGYGAGGGGGGASRNGFNSGAGGNGANGFVRIICYQ